MGNQLGALIRALLGPSPSSDGPYTHTFGPVRQPDYDAIFTEGGDDTLPHDLAPHFCWRCDATPATTEVGLCGECHLALRTADAAAV